MELNFTVIYVSLMIPITLTYLDTERDKVKGMTPLYFLFFLLVVSVFRSDAVLDQIGRASCRERV